jgi:16S rRNA (guanine966-N2)-methyltransferase
MHAMVLDLFAGTGALGLEAFSRDARFVVFIDNTPLALQLIKRNILHCLSGYSGNCEMRVVKHDLTKSIPKNKLPKETHAGFDLIFADPPYDKNISCSVLEIVNNSSLLTKNGLLIVEERHNVELPSSLSTLERVDRRVYGETAFCFYRSSSTA